MDKRIKQKYLSGPGNKYMFNSVRSEGSFLVGIMIFMKKKKTIGLKLAIQESRIAVEFGFDFII